MKIVFYIFLILSILLLADCLAYYNYEISLAGYYSDVILFWLWLVTSLAVIVLFWRKILAKVFLGIIVLALILSILPMALPFYTFMLSMTSAGLKIDKELSDGYSARIVGYSVMAHPWLEVIEKKGLLEKKVIECTEMQLEAFNKDRIDVKYDAQLRPALRISEAKDLVLDKESDSTISIVLFYGGPNKTLTFNKINNRLIKINGKEAVNQ